MKSTVQDGKTVRRPAGPEMDNGRRGRLLMLLALPWLALEPASAGAQGVDAATRRGVPLLGAQNQMNPAISVVIDGAFYRATEHEGLGHVLEELEGFGHVHHDEADHDDHDHGFQNGFNLRHLELMFAADVDPYFRAWAVVAVEDHGAEIEEAVVRTSSLPGGFQLKFGKFFSDISRQNAMHAHDWNFADMPLVNLLLLGDHGLNEKGLQVSWLAPTPFFLTLGLEVLQGENETAFAHLGEDHGPLPDRDGPRLFTAWAKTAPMLQGAHALQLGLFALRGVHQEEHGADNPGGTHWLDGHQTLFGADFVYRHTPPSAYGHRWLTIEGGYLWREKRLKLVGHNNPDRAGLIGNHLRSRQDGAYLQGTYGVLPRWRVGVRGDLIGMTNEDRKPSGASESHDTSYRLTGMVDWTLTEFSRLRLQASHGEYDTHDGREDVSEVMLQGIFTLGAHGAHSF